MKRFTRFFSILYLAGFLLLPTGCHGIGDKSMSVTIIYSATVVLSLLILIAYFFMIRKKDLWFILLFSSIPIVNLGYQWLSVAKSLETALWANRLSYLGSVVLPLAMLMIIINVTKLHYKRRLPMVLFGLAAVVFLIAASPGILDIYYKDVTLDFINGVTVLNKVYGVLHPLYLFYLLGYFSAMIVIIIRASIKKIIPSNAHAVVLLLAVFVNIGIWLFEQLSRIDFELLSVSYIICELFLLGLDYVLQEQEKLLEEQTAVLSASFVAAHAEPAPSFSTERIDRFIRGTHDLTHTERLVFDLYLQGKSTKEVLETLNIKENTLKYHNKNIYSKLGVTSRKELKEIAKHANICKSDS